MRIVDVILRTHSGPNVHGGTRVFKGPKEELILGCMRSLLRTMKNVDATRHSLRLTIIDDHSTESCVTRMKELVATAPFETRFMALETHGVGPSFGASYVYARDNAQDLIYFVEDDYLHAPSALPEMLEAQELFSRNLGGEEVAIFPVDYTTNYDPRIAMPSRLVLGPYRHWHTDHSTTGTFFISHKAFIKNFDHIIKMALYRIDPKIGEYNTINNTWRNGVHLFSPIPSLALHMQDEPIISPFIDWKMWWDDYAG